MNEILSAPAERGGPTGSKLTVHVLQRQSVSLQTDAKFDFHFVFHFHAASSDADRSHAKVGLLDRCSSSIDFVRPRHIEAYGTSLTVQRQPARDDPMVWSLTFDLSDSKRISG